MTNKLRVLCTLLLCMIASVGWSDTYQKYSGEITEGEYIICSNIYAMKAEVSSNRFVSQSTYNTNSSSHTVTEALIVWKIEKNGDYYTLYNASTQKYAASTGAANRAKLEGTITDYSCWTITGTETYEFVNKKNQSNNVNCNLRCNDTYGFACYSTSTGKALTLYKKVESPTYTITAQSNNTSYGTVSLNGCVITGSPNNGYRYADPAYTVYPANSATVAQDGNAFTVTPSANTTVTINFEAIPTYIVTLGDDNSTLTETIGGAGVTLPSRSTLNGYDFAGWSTTNVSEETTAAPTIIPAGSYAPTANITLYPVYTKTGGGTTPSAFSVGNTGNYAIVSAEQSGKYFALPTNPTVSSGKITAQEITVSVSNGVKYITTANAEGFTWTIASATNGYTLSDGSNYIYHSNGGASGTNLAYGVNTSYTWAFTADGDYVTMAGMNGSTTNNRGLLFSGTTIGGYALSNANSSGYYKVMILPISAGSTTYYWSAPVAAAVEIPSIAIAENPFFFSTTATITCATEGAAIKYSFDGENWSDYSSALTITETKTIYAKAIKGENESDVAQVTATKNLATPSVSISGDLTLDLDGKTNVNAGTLTAAVTYNDAAIDGATVTWSSSNTNVATIDASTGAVTLLATGNVTFTATYAGNSDYAESTGTKAVTVIDNKAPGTENNPYTVTQARAAIDASTGTQGVYATGIVCKASTSLYSNKYLSYYISDDGKTDSPQLEAYNGLGKDGANFTSADDIQVGDEVVIYGNLMKYNSTYEFAANNKLISLVRNTLSAPTFSVAAGTYKEAQSVEITCATEDATIHYSFDNENWTLYENPIIISESKTLYAKAMKGDKEETASAQYVILIDTAIEGYKYVKVTSTEDITDGQYLIVYEDGTNSVAFDGGLETLDAVSNTVSVTISNNEIAASTFMQAAEFTIDVTNGTLKSASGYYIGVSSNDNKLNQTDDASIYKNTFSLDENGAVISAVFDGSTMYLRYNSTSNQLRFRYYKNAGQQAIQLYKLVETVSPIVVPAEPVKIDEGFYTIKNNGNGKYVNVAGRRTVTFVDDTDAEAGTVIKVKADENGQVQILRSQGVDIPGYAQKAMNYVPEIVQLVVEKLNNLDPDQQIMGENGMQALLKAFNEGFDYHLYTEQAEGGIRIYGKTPSMQKVVEFYEANKDNVDAKLPMLESLINKAIDKVLEKTGGSGASILKHFSLAEIWTLMGSPSDIAQPTEDTETQKAFLQWVLRDKTRVWDFAYQTAMIYWKPLINHDKVQQNLSQLGDLAQYVTKIENIQPESKYYIVQNEGKLDVFNQSNIMITEDDARTIWTLGEPRTEFKVNFNEENTLSGKYYTTLYTDFAYTLPEGVKAMTVTKISELNGKSIAITKAIEGAVPAQTPVLLESESADAQTLTLSTEDGAAPTDNLLKGPDYLINEYGIKTAQIVSLFSIVKDILGETFYQNYIEKYEHLMARNAGTVNNKYFFGLDEEDLNLCTYKNENNQEDCVVRNLSTGEQNLGFYDNWTVEANKAFLVSETNPVKLWLKGDVDRDGDVDYDDVKALVKIVLGEVTEENNTDNYDFEAAKVNEDTEINIADVTALVNILLP